MTRPTVLRRIASMVYESLLVAAIVLGLLVLPHLLIGAFTLRLASPPLLWAHFFVLLLVYFVGFWTHGGQTPAMKTWRIRVLTDDGRPIRPLRGLLRYLLAWPSIALAGVGILWALVDRDGRFLHDRIAGTQIVAASP